MGFINERQNQIFKDNIAILLGDMGRSIIVYRKQTGTDCPYCIYDNLTKRSSGKPASGYVWTAHPNYKGTMLVCPECSGRGLTDLTTQTTVSDCIIQDISGEQIEYGKYGYFKPGTKRIYCKLESILTDSSNLNSDTILEPKGTLKILIDGNDYRLVTLNRLGLTSLYLAELLVEAMDVMEN